MTKLKQYLQIKKNSFVLEQSLTGVNQITLMSNTDDKYHNREGVHVNGVKKLRVKNPEADEMFKQSACREMLKVNAQIERGGDTLPPPDCLQGSFSIAIL